MIACGIMLVFDGPVSLEVANYFDLQKLPAMSNARNKIVMNWSSGKDAALAYLSLLADPSCTVTHLLTTLNEEYDRIFMHGIREQLLDKQAERMNIPLTKVKLPASPDDTLYKHAMLNALTTLKSEGVTAAAYGDIYLEDLKTYREQQLAQIGFEAVFPLWKKDTTELVRQVEEAGIEAIIVCVNAKSLGKELLGRKISAELLAAFPSDVDPCGENGEYHTFVYNAPFFGSPIPIVTGDIVHKTYKGSDDNNSWDTGFYFLDVHPL
jgi:uncharacterized protein (TIGR00290 family)